MLTGFRYGTGFCIAYSGPVGALICFLIVGVDVFFVMQCLGEMSTLFPIQGKHTDAAERGRPLTSTRCFHRACKSLRRSSIRIFTGMELLVPMQVHDLLEYQSCR
jgi:hypothetical protein